MSIPPLQTSIAALMLLSVLAVATLGRTTEPANALPTVSALATTAAMLLIGGVGLLATAASVLARSDRRRRPETRAPVLPRRGLPPQPQDLR